MAKTPVLKLLLLLLLLRSTVFAHPTSTEGPHLFLHPFGLFYGLIKNQDVNFYLTAQIPLNDELALIINPSILNGDDYYRYGSGLGIRSLSDGIFGSYFQLMPSVHYLKRSDYGKDNETISGIMTDVLVYYGVKFGPLSLDAGIGYGWTFLPKSYKAYPYYEGNNHGVAFDINLGFGLLWGRL